MECRIIERNADVLLNAWKDIGLEVNTGKTKQISLIISRQMQLMRHSGQVTFG
jgi:hypothetical protein